MNRKQQSNGKIARCILCCILAAGLLVGSGALGYFTHKWTKGEAPAATADGGGMVIGSSEGYGITLTSTEIPLSQYDEYGIMPTAESAQTVTATLKDYEGYPLYEHAAADVKLAWALSWKTDSGWGKGKTVTEYVSLSTSENTHAATLSCLQPFGEQIILKASVVGDEDVSNTATVDYRQKYASWSATIRFPQNAATVKFGENLGQHARGFVAIDFPAAIGSMPLDTRGGSIQFNVIGSDVYTLPLDFTVDGFYTKSECPQKVTEAGGKPLDNYASIVDARYDEDSHTLNNVPLHNLLGLSQENINTGFTVAQYAAIFEYDDLGLGTPVGAVSIQFTGVKVNGQPVEDDFDFLIMFNTKVRDTSVRSVDFDRSGLEF